MGISLEMVMRVCILIFLIFGYGVFGYGRRIGDDLGLFKRHFIGIRKNPTSNIVTRSVPEVHWFFKGNMMKNPQYKEFGKRKTWLPFEYKQKRKQEHSRFLK